MKTITDNLNDQVQGIECYEIVELGVMSEETRGSFWGSIWDGGYNVQKP